MQQSIYCKNPVSDDERKTRSTHTVAGMHAESSGSVLLLTAAAALLAAAHIISGDS